MRTLDIEIRHYMLTVDVSFDDGVLCVHVIGFSNLRSDTCCLRGEASQGWFDLLDDIAYDAVLGMHLEAA